MVVSDAAIPGGTPREPALARSSSDPPRTRSLEKAKSRPKAAMDEVVLAGLMPLYAPT
jgi:hypothetical protein